MNEKLETVIKSLNSMALEYDKSDALGDLMQSSIQTKARLLTIEETLIEIKAKLYDKGIAQARDEYEEALSVKLSDFAVKALVKYQRKEK